MEMQAYPLKLLIRGGLNQIYDNNVDKYTSFGHLLDLFTARISKETGLKIEEVNDYFFKISATYWRDNEIFELEKFSNHLQGEFAKLSGNQGLSLNEIESSFFKVSDFSHVDEFIFQEITSEGYQIIFLYPDPMSAYLENSILKLLNLDKYFTYLLENDSKLLFEIENSPKSFIFFDYNLAELFKYHTRGCWTIYLTHYIITSTNIQLEDNPYYKLNCDNLSFLKENGKFFQFSFIFFIHVKNYLPLYSTANSQINELTCDANVLNSLIDQMNPIRVLLFYRFLFKKAEIIRAKHYISNDKVMFISHIGGMGICNQPEEFMELSINLKFHCILAKMSEFQESVLYKKMIQKIEEYPLLHKEILNINSLKYLDSFLNREKMICFMRDFCELDEIKKLNEEFGSKVQLPKCFSVQLRDVYEEEQLREFINKNDMNLPIIIKYTGPTKVFNHLLINVITDTGIGNYINFMKDFAKGCEDSVSLVMQSYINHGGYVMKLYRVTKDSTIHFRPSLPDVSESLVSMYEEYKRGFFQVSTDQLLSPNFVDFWKKLSNNAEIKNLTNLDYLKAISHCFENYSKTTLFGLDFLLDYKKNEYYLVDCNIYPGYKEHVNEFNDIITRHVIMTYEDFQNEEGK